MMLTAHSAQGCLPAQSVSHRSSGAPTAWASATHTRHQRPGCRAQPVPLQHDARPWIASRPALSNGRPSVCAPLCAVAAEAPAAPVANNKGTKPMKVIIAGAGIGGLVLAVGLLKQGFEVQVYERDLTAIRGEGKYRGPIQVQSNALAALEAIDQDVAEEVLREGTITGDRINGLVDGLTGEWYIKFDTFHPAVDNGLPVTRVISRVLLQHILAKAVEKYGGPDVICNGSNVTQFEERVNPATGVNEVVVYLEDGRTCTGDMLVGADGIRSRIRKQLIGETMPNYSGYTCYTGISDFTPADIDIVGYRVFLGNGQYFVSSDVGGGKMQWYGFHKEPAGGMDIDGTRKARLLQIFGSWNDNVVDLIKATPEEDVLRRDIYDRPPIFSWSKGRVALLGDSAHAMQPNLGQGGCMAIEDAYELAVDLRKAVDAKGGDSRMVDVEQVLRSYQDSRLVRASVIHGMAGMAAFMASTYKCYLGEGWAQWVGDGTSKWVQSLRIPHPGRVVGRVVMLLTMPSVLGWVLGGNVEKVAPHRMATCRLSDKAKAFEDPEYYTFMNNDEAIIRSSHADWLLVAERDGTENVSSLASYDVCSTAQIKGIFMDIGDKPSVVGRVPLGADASASGVQLCVEDEAAAPQHAQVWRDAQGTAFLKDLSGRGTTWVNGKQLAANSTVQLHAGDAVEFGQHPSPEVYKVKLQHVTLRSDDLKGFKYSTLIVGKPRATSTQPEERRLVAA